MLLSRTQVLCIRLCGRQLTRTCGQVHPNQIWCGQFFSEAFSPKILAEGPVIKDMNSYGFRTGSILFHSLTLCWTCKHFNGRHWQHLTWSKSNRIHLCLSDLQRGFADRAARSRQRWWQRRLARRRAASVEAGLPVATTTSVSTCLRTGAGSTGARQSVRTEQNARGNN